MRPVAYPDADGDVMFVSKAYEQSECKTSPGESPRAFRGAAQCGHRPTRQADRMTSRPSSAGFRRTLVTGVAGAGLLLLSGCALQSANAQSPGTSATTS